MGLLDQRSYGKKTEGFIARKGIRAFPGRRRLRTISGRKIEVSQSTEDAKLQWDEAFELACLREPT